MLPMSSVKMPTSMDLPQFTSQHHRISYHVDDGMNDVICGPHSMCATKPGAMLKDYRMAMASQAAGVSEVLRVSEILAMSSGNLVERQGNNFSMDYRRISP